MPRKGVSLVLLLPWAALAQGTTATFYGVVQDGSGGAIVGAEANLRHEGTGVVRTQMTGATGEFAFQFLDVGVYRLRISVQGFKAFENAALELRAGQQARQTFRLEVGPVTERVQVTSETPLVNTVTAEQRESLSRREITELPVGRRDLSRVMSIGTGVSRVGDTGEFILNGLGRAAASFTMDGIDASANPQAPQVNMKEGHNNIAVVTMEAVEEVQVSKGVFSAEFGRALSGNVNVVTKSGTNELHGSLFELFNAEELNGRSQFLRVRPGVAFNQFGGSLGGPIRRDKLFLFGAYEGYQDRSFAALQENVPSARLRAAMLARVPDYKLFLDGYPLPNQPTPETAATGAFIGSGTQSGKDNHVTVKPDWWITSANKLTATYVRGRPDRTVPRVYLTNSRRFTGTQERLNLSFTHIRASWTAESRFGYNKNDRDRIDGLFDLIDPNKKETKLGGRRVPAINTLGFSQSGELNFIGAPNRSFEQKAAVTAGRHSLKFGGIYFAREIGSANIENPVLRYQNEAELLANIPTTIQMTFGRDDFDGKAKEFGLFLQDDWRASPKLTLNLGLRYDYFSNLTANKDRERGPHVYNPNGLTFPDFRVGAFRPVNNPYDKDAFNMGPRFGFAYNPDGKSKTVIRGGFATLFTYLNGEIVKNAVQNSPKEPFRVQLTRLEGQQLNVKFPAYNEDVLALVAQGTAAPAFQVIDPKIVSPYSMNFSFTIERALTDTLALETAIVGTRGVKFVNLRRYNLPDRVTGIRPNPAVGAERFHDNSESTRYYAWQTSLRKRMSRGLLVNLHYTWGKALAYNRGDLGFGNIYVQDFFNLKGNLGRSEGDINHRLVSDFVYELRKPATGWTRHAIGGWQLAGVLTVQTGLPLALTQPNALDGQRPDLIDPSSPVNSSYRTNLVYLNRAAFAPVPVSRVSGATLRPGTVGNGAIEGPGFWNLDLSIGRAQMIRERYKLQFRAELLNSLNHTNFAGLDTNIESARFGTLTATAGARVVQLNLRMSF